MKFIFFPIAIIALQQSTKATAATNWFVPTGGSATIDCPSGAQCCLVGETQQWENVDTGAGSIASFGTPLCYGGTGTTLSGCGTEPACVFSCEDACVVEGGTPVAVTSESEAAATTTTEATTAATSSEAMMTTTEATASSSSATAITYEIPNGGSTAIDCPSGAQCCTVGDTNLGTVTGEAGSTITFGRSGDICYGKSGSTFNCETDPSCVLACDAGCVVPGGMATASSTSSEAEAAAAMTTTEATTSTAADSSEATTATTTTGATTTIATTTVASDTTPSPTAKPTSSASAPSMVVAAASTIAAISAFLV